MKTPKILIVEDNYINTKLYQAYLRDYDVQFVIARDGVEGVEMIKNNPDVDLILMNYMMPRMDGMEATVKIREFNKDVIIIMNSAAIISANELIKQSLEAGCNDYLIVPFRLTQFIQMIEDYLGYKLIKK